MSIFATPQFAKQIYLRAKGVTEKQCIDTLCIHITEASNNGCSSGSDPVSVGSCPTASSKFTLGHRPEILTS